jgi:IS30 family transposase
MVEGKSRYTCLAKAKNKTTTAVISSINQQMRPNETMSEALNPDVFFAKPYHYWERGLNENTNGLVRQYFPKRILFDSIMDDDLQNVARKINNPPCKCLGYKRPF